MAHSKKNNKIKDSIIKPDYSSNGQTNEYKKNKNKNKRKETVASVCFVIS